MGYDEMEDLINEFEYLKTIAAGKEEKQRVQISMNIIVGKLEQMVVDENNEHVVRIFGGKAKNSLLETEDLLTFKLPKGSTGVIGTVIGMLVAFLA